MVVKTNPFFNNAINQKKKKKNTEFIVVQIFLPQTYSFQV